MRVFSWDKFIGSGSLRGVDSAVTIGVFDGIHRGHLRLLDSILEANTQESIVLTFRYNPRRFLKPHLFPGDITTMKQKLSLLEDIGIDTVILIDFSHDFSKLSGRDFTVSILRNTDLRLLVLGDNFRCGYRGASSAYDVRDILSEYGVEVDVTPPVTWKGATLSSTRIRAAVREGELKEAREMMNRPYILDIASVPIEKKMDVRTTEKGSLQQVLPPPGRYLVDIHSPTNSFRDELIIDHEVIAWRAHKAEESKSIEFLHKIGEGA